MKFLPNLNVAAWLANYEDHSSSLQAVDSSYYSTLPASAAQSRVGSPVQPYPVADRPDSDSANQFQERSGLKKISAEDEAEEKKRKMKMKMKKKGAPAKSLTAERRRRKKLNEKLLMLRSIVPNITKMDKVSILGDAVHYLEELMQKITRLENELDPVQSDSTSPAVSSVTQATSFTPTPPSFPARTDEPLPSPNCQPARIEVTANGSEMKIHVFCTKIPGLLLSVTGALESSGLEIRKALVSSFNGFVLDMHCAQQCAEGGQYVYPEQIKDLLLEAIGFTLP